MVASGDSAGGEEACQEMGVTDKKLAVSLEVSSILFFFLNTKFSELTYRIDTLYKSIFSNCSHE